MVERDWNAGLESRFEDRSRRNFRRFHPVVQFQTLDLLSQVVFSCSKFCME